MRCVDDQRIYAPAVPGPLIPPPPGFSWHDLMGIALQAAQNAELGGDVPVGAVVVSGDGEILATAGNRVEQDHDPTAHAEILALRGASQRMASSRLLGCILVVTLEPCLMCAGAIGMARLAGVVFGAVDARAGAVISLAECLQTPFSNGNIWHMAGIRSRECAELLTNFFMTRR